MRQWWCAYIFVVAEAAEEAEFPHGSVGEGGVLEDALDFLDGHGVVDVFVAAGFDHHRGGPVAHLLQHRVVLGDHQVLLPVVCLVGLVLRC